jgi:hypothetical protein
MREHTMTGAGRAGGARVGTLAAAVTARGAM